MSKTQPRTQAEAAAIGSHHYQGNPCAICGGTLRYTISSNCVACTKERSRARRAKLRDAMNAAKEAQGEAGA